MVSRIPFGQHKIVDPYNRSYIFPLYLYPAHDLDRLFADEGNWPPGEDGRVPNLSKAFVAAMGEALGMGFLPHPPAPSPYMARGRKAEDEGGLRDASPELWQKLKPLARQMRHEPTAAEDRLWQAIRDRQVGGAKFRRQHAIDRFIVDFYSSEASLIIEVDGEIHQYTVEEDAIRQAFLEAQGFTVLRFGNDAVLNDLSHVLEKIAAELSPLSMDGEGPGVRSGLEYFTPEDVFHYAYAVFHCPTYRDRYAEFLKIDFPRLPLTSDKDLFGALCERGAALVKLHLLEGIGRRDLMTTYNTGSGVVERGYPRFELQLTSPPDPLSIQGEGKIGRVYINATQYFEGVPEETWNFQVGGYQVLQKWLKDRRGRILTHDEALHYQKIVVALTQTRDIMGEIDDLIETWPMA